MAGLARAGNHVSTPAALTGFQIHCFEPAAHAEFSARHAGDNHIFNDQRCASDHFALTRIGHLHFPNFGTVGLVQRDDATVDHRRDDHIAGEYGTAVINAAACHGRRVVTIRLRIVFPHLARNAAASVELGDFAPTRGQVKESIFRDRRAFQAGERERNDFLTAALRSAHGPGKGYAQIFDVGFVDLIQPRETMGFVISMMIQPVAGLALAAD